MKKILVQTVCICFILLAGNVNAQTIPQRWDSLKAAQSPVLQPPFSANYSGLQQQPLHSYGWEDGIHLSRSGDFLYALYSPADLLSWIGFINSTAGNPNYTLCDVLGTGAYYRNYAPLYGMDITTNAFGCDTFINLDILYSRKNTATGLFDTWQLSGIPTTAAIEGSPMPVFNASNAALIDIFLFTKNNDIWMIRNAADTLSGYATAVRLPTPINPDSTEFQADNPHLERLNGDTLLLVYEKYTNAAFRDFYFTQSYDDGINWTLPQLITSVSSSVGHIEHPHLWQQPNNGPWTIWYSLDYDIWRAVQSVPGNWDSWGNHQMVISKGTAASLGEPTLDASGNLSFAVGYAFPQLGDSTDVVDVDPWIARILPNAITEQAAQPLLRVFPNPASATMPMVLECDAIVNPDQFQVADIAGRVIHHVQLRALGNGRFQLIWPDVPAPGIYVVSAVAGGERISQRVVVW